MYRQKRVLEVTVPGHRHWLALALINLSPVAVFFLSFLAFSDILTIVLVNIVAGLIYGMGLLWPDKLVEEGPASVNVVTLIGISVFLEGLMLVASNWVFFLFVWPVHLAGILFNAYVNILYYREINKDKVV